MHPLAPQALDEHVVDPLEPDRAVREDFHHMVGRGKDIGVAQDEEGARRRAVDEAHRGREDGDAGALGADQRTGDVEAVLRQ